MITSHSAAMCDGDTQATPPSPANCSVTAERTSQACTLKPLRNNERAMPSPIAPRPTTPTFLLFMGYSSGKQRLLERLQGTDVGRVVNKAAVDRISTTRISQPRGAVIQDVSRDLIEHQGNPVFVVLSGCHTG